MNCEVFSEWLEHFIKFVKPTPDSKVLLLLDGSKSHTHSFEALQRASECGILMISLPPHTSHRLQPLDLCFFKPLKTYYYQELEKWLRIHPGRAVLQYQISQLFECAYGKATSCNIALNGFRKAGIHPLNRDGFDETGFLSAEVSDRPIEENDTVFDTSGKDIAPSALSTTDSSAPSTSVSSVLSTLLHLLH